MGQQIERARLMKKFEEWLSKLKDSWSNNDIDSVVQLFSKECVYYETPFSLLQSTEAINKVWLPVLDHKDIRLNFNVVRSNDTGAVIAWAYKFIHNGESKLSEGAYYIELDKDGLCNFFVRMKTV